jgi:hypothetical protein
MKGRSGHRCLADAALLAGRRGLAGIPLDLVRHGRIICTHVQIRKTIPDEVWRRDDGCCRA